MVIEIGSLWKLSPMCDGDYIKEGYVTSASKNYVHLADEFAFGNWEWSNAVRNAERRKHISMVPRKYWKWYTKVANPVFSTVKCLMVGNKPALVNDMGYLKYVHDAKDGYGLSQ